MKSSLRALLLALAASAAFGGPASTARSSKTQIAGLVGQALAFKAMLTPARQSALQKAYSPQNAAKWSNLPDFACGPGCRNGVRLSDLSVSQRAAAKALIAAALGNTTDEGYDEFIQVTLSDSILSTDSEPGDFSHLFIWIAFLNAPSDTGAWMLQFGGHHYAANVSFNKGGVIGVTPTFKGVEPIRFTISGGRECTPLAQEQAAFKAMLAALSPDQLAAAKLSGSFRDVVMGPGQDGRFPAARTGLRVGGLSARQQSLVQAAMEPFLADADSSTAEALRSVYAAELADTHIGYAGDAALASNGSYVRIEGPSAWIEFVVQQGVVYPDQVHYHSVWRDRKRDYGNGLTDSPAAARPVKRKVRFSTGPTASGSALRLAFHVAVENARVRVFDQKGNRVLERTGISGSDFTLEDAPLPKGLYTILVDDGAVLLTSRFALF